MNKEIANLNKSLKQISKEEMTLLVGGQKVLGGSGTKDDPYQLEEVIVTPK